MGVYILLWKLVVHCSLEYPCSWCILRWVWHGLIIERRFHSRTTTNCPIGNHVFVGACKCLKLISGGEGAVRVWESRGRFVICGMRSNKKWCEAAQAVCGRGCCINKSKWLSHMFIGYNSLDPPNLFRISYSPEVLSAGENSDASSWYCGLCNSHKPLCEPCKGFF